MPSMGDGRLRNRGREIQAESPGVAVLPGFKEEIEAVLSRITRREDLKDSVLVGPCDRLPSTRVMGLGSAFVLNIPAPNSLSSNLFADATVLSLQDWNNRDFMLIGLTRDDGRTLLFRIDNKGVVTWDGQSGGQFTFAQGELQTDFDLIRQTFQEQSREL